MEWPTSNERLFKSDSDWQLNACINSYHTTLGMVADGYKEAADSLAVSVAHKQATLDTVIYPIVYLYRQYLELKIKEIIYSSRQLESEPGRYPTHHYLNNLWAEALRLLKKHYGTDLPLELSNMQSCIDEFHLYDESSMAFRYPTDKNGKPMLRDLHHINLRNLVETMERISNLLESMTCGLDAHLDAQHDMMSDFGGY